MLLIRYWNATNHEVLCDPGLAGRTLRAFRTDKRGDTRIAASDDGSFSWSTRVMAARHETSEDTAAPIWPPNRLKPWKVAGSSVERSGLEVKFVDVVGLYMDPPGTRVVITFDKQTQSKRWTGLKQCHRKPRPSGRSAPFASYGPRSATKKHCSQKCVIVVVTGFSGGPLTTVSIVVHRRHVTDRRYTRT